MSSSFGLKAGVHKNTKVYMEPSKSDCIAPSKAIFSSEITQNDHIMLMEKMIIN